MSWKDNGDIRPKYNRPVQEVVDEHGTNKLNKIRITEEDYEHDLARIYYERFKLRKLRFLYNNAMWDKKLYCDFPDIRESCLSWISPNTKLLKKIYSGCDTHRDVYRYLNKQIKKELTEGMAWWQRQDDIIKHEEYKKDRQKEKENLKRQIQWIESTLVALQPDGKYDLHEIGMTGEEQYMDMIAITKDVGDQSNITPQSYRARLLDRKEKLEGYLKKSCSA